MTLAFSTRAIDIWNESQQEQHYDDLESDKSHKKNDRHYNYGYRRINLLAAFFNCVFLIFIFIFDWMETIHHLMEHWEAQAHETPEKLEEHGDHAHQSESQRFISMFALVRIFVLGSYMLLEARKIPVYTYMQANWMGWPARG
jgi:divalent metal cation (Fe/Co/Zn/Cd) transporter